MRRAFLSVTLVGLIAASPAFALAAPPVAQLRPVTDQYGATTLVDNYRWMEGEPNQELRNFVAAAGGYAEAILARIPGRDRLARTIATLDAPSVIVPTVVQDGGTIFYLRRGPNDDVARLYLRGATEGSPRLLVDPELLPDATAHSEIGAVSPSPDGAYVAYTLADSGPDSSVLRIHDVARNTTLSERFENARFASVAWLGDSTGFYYTRPVGEADPEARWDHLGVYLHRLGTNKHHDTLVLDSAHLPFPFHGQHIIPRLMMPPSSDYALAVVSDGVSPEITVYTVLVSQLPLQPAPWGAVSAQGEGATQISVSGSLAFLLTQGGGAPFHVTNQDLADPGAANARTVLTGGDGLITGIAAAADALYVARRQGAGMHLLRLDYHDRTPQDIRLPFAGTIAPALAPGYGATGGLIADPRAAGALFSVESWTHPRTWLRFDTHLIRAVDAGLVPPPPVDLSGYQSIETTATARDGTKIPLSIIASETVALDHARPVLLEAFGSYGYAFDPRFLPAALAWADQGGVYAIAHVRGGGELGPAWHAAGQFANKHNTVTDLLSCADALVARGYTDAAHLAVIGTNEGAIAAGGAITWMPGAVRAAVLRDGLVNPLRTDEASAPEAVMEFGSARDPAQFANLLPVDAYSQVREGIEYPAVLLTSHLTGSQVPAWQSAKMDARLAAATTSGRPVLLRQTPSVPQTRAARAAAEADELGFLLWQLGVPGFQPGGGRKKDE